MTWPSLHMCCGDTVVTHVCVVRCNWMIVVFPWQRLLHHDMLVQSERRLRIGNVSWTWWTILWYATTFSSMAVFFKFKPSWILLWSAIFCTLSLYVILVVFCVTHFINFFQDEWLTCQRNWLYLESIFSAPDIQRQLPAEAKMFMIVDKSWKEIMRKVNRLPNALRWNFACRFFIGFYLWCSTCVVVQLSISQFSNSSVCFWSCSSNIPG